MDGHLEDCVGSRIFVRSINSLFPCGCIAGTDSTAGRGVKINLFVCVRVWFVCVVAVCRICVCSVHEHIPACAPVTMHEYSKYPWYSAKGGVCIFMGFFTPFLFQE